MEVLTIILNREHITRLSHELRAETSEHCGIIQQLLENRLLSNIALLTNNIVATVSSFLMTRNSLFIFLTYSRIWGILEFWDTIFICRFEPKKYHSSSIKFLGKRTGSRPTMMARTTDPYTELFSAAFLVSTSHIEVNTRCRLSLTNDGLNQ